jgi:hypothetical protein
LDPRFARDAYIASLLLAARPKADRLEAEVGRAWGSIAELGHV